MIVKGSLELFDTLKNVQIVWTTLRVNNMDSFVYYSVNIYDTMSFTLHGCSEGFAGIAHQELKAV